MKPIKEHVNTVMLKEMARKLSYLSGILDASPDVILVVDLKKKILLFSKSGQKILGYRKSDLLNSHLTKIFKNGAKSKELMKLITDEGDIDEFEILAYTSKGHGIPFSVGIRKLFDDEKDHIGYVLNMHNIHRRNQLEKTLRRQYAELDSVVTHSGAMIVTTDPKGRITKINPAAEQVLGVRNKDMVGRTMIDFYVDKKLRREVVKKLRTQENIEYEADIYTNGKDIRTFSVNLSNIRSPLSEKLLGTVGISRDITERRQAERRVQEMLVTDSLTSLGNRRHFFEVLNDQLNQAAQSPKKSFCLAFLDMDGFKAYNDTFGHQKGDDLLNLFGQLCLKLKQDRKSLLFFRYGGDEFVAIFPKMDLKKAHQILEKLRRNFFRHTRKHVTLSIGLTKVERKDSIERIVNRVDSAVYTSKNSGRNRITILEG